MIIFWQFLFFLKAPSLQRSSSSKDFNADFNHSRSFPEDPAADGETKIHNNPHLQICQTLPLILCCVWNVFRGTCSWVTLHGVTLKCFCWRGAARREKLGLWISSLHAAPDLQELEEKFYCRFFFFPALTCSHGSGSLRGAERSQRSLFSGAGWAPRSSGLQENSFSLWHTLRRSIISLSLSLSRARSPPLSPVRSVFTEACKITWQEQLKALDRTHVPGVPQTFTNFFLSLKWRVHWKEVHVFLPKGQILLNLLQGDSTEIYPNPNFSEQKLLNLIKWTCWNYRDATGVHFYVLFLDSGF